MKKIILFVILFAMLVSLSAGVLSGKEQASDPDGTEDNENGVMPTEVAEAKDDTVYSTSDGFAYRLEKHFDKSPDTIEAWIKTKKGATGSIISNFYYSSDECQMIRLDVVSGGKIRINWSNSAVSHTFSNTAVNNGEWHHIALVRDGAAKTFTLYIDGELAEVLNAESRDVICEIPMNIGVGNDIWNTKKDPLEGSIKQVTVYNGAISQERVRADMNNSDIKDSPEDAYLLGNWNLGVEWTEREVEDSSPNNNNAKLITFEKYVGVVDTGYYDYAIVGIGDIQAMVNRNVQKLNNMTSWIAENTEKMKFKFAFQVGDLSDFGERPDMYNIAAKALSKLDGILPYSFVQGNHDYDDNFSDARPSNSFNKFFNYSKFSTHENFGGSYDGKTMANTYWLYDVGDGVKYVVINLEYRPRMEVIRWAGRICDMYPQHRAIIVTHGYIGFDGNPLTTGDSQNASSAKTVYDNLIVKHQNIFMAFGGHVGADDIIMKQTLGEHGNTITSVHIDVQFTTYKGGSMSEDPFLILKFNETAKTVSFLYYSVAHDACFNIQNQYTFSFADPNNPTIGG